MKVRDICLGCGYSDVLPVQLAVTLVQSAAHLHLRDDRGETPLHWAVRTADLTMLRLLLDAGSAVDIPNDDLETPLALACGAGVGTAAADLLIQNVRVSRCFFGFVLFFFSWPNGGGF